EEDICFVEGSRIKRKSIYDTKTLAADCIVKEYEDGYEITGTWIVGDKWLVSWCVDSGVFCIDLMQQQQQSSQKKKRRRNPAEEMGCRIETGNSLLDVAVSAQGQVAFVWKDDSNVKVYCKSINDVM